MRTTTEMKTIKVSVENWKRLKKDRDEFQKTIGGGKWSIDDAITERSKILNTLEFNKPSKKLKWGKNE